MTPLGWTEILGLTPVGERAAQAWIAIRGAEGVPPSRYDRSSLRLLRPSLAWPLWRGVFAVPGKAVLTNLFNHTPTPIADGWSVRRTQVRDFRGGDLTYDSHNGTDLSIPVGSVVTAAAPGVVARVWTEFNRGGLKIAIDHGDGLITSSAHLARALVVEGERVARGQPIALSGYSGLDGAVTFPFGIPHIHLNVWLDGAPVDPFGDAPLWRGGRPLPPRAGPEQVTAPGYDRARVDAVIASCTHAPTRAALAAVPEERRGAVVIAERCYYPTRFADDGPVHEDVHARVERLSLPFDGRFDGAVFVDELDG